MLLALQDPSFCKTINKQTIKKNPPNQILKMMSNAYGPRWKESVLMFQEPQFLYISYEEKNVKHPLLLSHTNSLTNP